MTKPRAHLDVLFVEDSETDAHLVARELKKAGFHLRWHRVESARSLRETLVDRHWDLVVSDSNVPGLGVSEALAITREIAPRVPVIVVSGSIAADDVLTAIRGGAADVVRKDDLDRLAPAVARELRRSGSSDRDLQARLLDAHEAERREIARGLHDQFGQLLTTLKLLLSSARGRSDAAARHRDLDEAMAIVEQAMEQVRDFSLTLWPTILEDAGLEAGLRWLAERQSRWLARPIGVDADPVPRQPVELETACFRIAQEALTNVVRHAAASDVQVRVRVLEDAIELVVSDDGRGFDPRSAWQQAAKGASLGLPSMRERAVLAGGALDIDSVPGSGTTVRARLPLSMKDGS